ncbi:MAG: hypothetical protein KDA45_12500 [Planctomycetales bacterium]|nr:hypothetical protein [Planctomycetales bacterium]
MRCFALCLMAVCVFTFGCNQPVETIPAVAPSSSGTTDDHGHDHDGDGDHADHDATDSASKGTTEVFRFVADKKLDVPNMSCPYACWPKVQETLAGQPGVEAVQLAEQPEGTAEGEIVERVVELKLNGDFNADAAIAALAKVNFEASVAK